MRTAVIALTKNGVELAGKIGQSLKADIFVKNEMFDKVIVNGQIVLMHPFAADFKDVIRKIFFEYDALIFVMACGIVVRSIVPYLRNKQTDPAVVVVDELGRFAISLLSGHIGGANRLAGKVAAVVGGIPVITTATDINGVIAFDELAVMNDCVIENIWDLKYISSELLNGGKVCFYSDCRLNGVMPLNIVPYYQEHPCKFAVVLSNMLQPSVIAEKVLYIRPKNLIMGIGCKKGKSSQEIREAIKDLLVKNEKSLLSLRCMASIDLKAREKGINDFSEEAGIPFVTYSAEEIQGIEHQLEPSDFVRKTTGVGCVAEACAMLAGSKTKLICPKTVYNGITLALAEEEKVFSI